MMTKDGCRQCNNALPIGSGANVAGDMANVICVFGAALYINMMGRQFNGIMSVLNEINYCPMCGRKLQTEKGEHND